MNIERWLRHIRDRDLYRGQIVHREDRTPRTPEYGDDWPGLSEPLRQALAGVGLEKPRSLQAEALEMVWSGDDVVLAGAPAGGKSLALQAAAAQTALEAPGGHTLIVCPYKSVAGAREHWFRRLSRELPELGALWGIYDGDTPRDRRRKMPGRSIVVTNPDMLHRVMLPQHTRWAPFFGGLRRVILQDLHAYSGLFGANAAGLFRRLLRVCHHHGASPQIAASSATLSNPLQALMRLTGRRGRCLELDNAPPAPQTCCVWNPATGPPTTETAHLMAEFAGNGVGTIAFSRSRVSCELIARYARSRLDDRAEDRVAAFRGGYPPRRRSGVQNRLYDATLPAVSSTNALELGLDAPHFQVSLVCGWPGSVRSFFQQAARSGRRGQPSLTIFVALQDPVNQFLVDRPSYIFERPFEPCVVDRDNPHVLAGQLRCAAHELPLTDDEAEAFGPGGAEALDILEDRDQVREARGGWVTRPGESPARELPLRHYRDRSVTIYRAEDGSIVGQVDWVGAHSLVHPGAIYLQGESSYLVQEFDREECRAEVEAVEVPYYTNPLGHCYVDSVDECLREHELPGGTAFLGDVTAAALTEGYEKRRYEDNSLLWSGGIELPPALWETAAAWLCTTPVRDAELAALGLTPELYGLGNALRLVLPLFMTCNALDLRPWAGSNNFPWPALYFYERYRCGLGFSEKFLRNLDSIMNAADENLSDCGCNDGCTSCVGDTVRPYIPNNPELETDNIPSRRETLLLLRLLRSDEPIEDLLPDVFGARGADRLLDGRRDLLEQRREMAREEPPRRLPDDEPMAGGRVPRGSEVPLQVRRNIRRRIQRMRGPVTEGEHEPVERAAIPAPEEESTLDRTDPESRHRGRMRRKLEQKRRAADRARTTDEVEDEQGKADEPDTAGPQRTRDDRLAAEAVRRTRGDE